MPHAAEAGHVQQAHADERQHAGLGHGRLARFHLVVFHDGQARQADPGLGVPVLRVADDLPQLAKTVGVFGEAAASFVLDQVERQQSHVAVAEQLVAGAEPIVLHGQQRGDFREGRLVRPGLAEGRGKDLQRLALLLLRGAQRIGQQAGIAAIDLVGKPGDLPAHVQRGVVALQEALRLAEEAVDPLEELRADLIVVKAFGLELGDVDLVEDRAEQFGLAIELCGEIVEDRRHGLGVVAMDHDGHVVLLAELLREFGPAAVVFALGIEQVRAAGAEAQAELGPRKREGDQQRGDDNDGNGEASHEHGEELQRLSQEREFRLRLPFRGHKLNSSKGIGPNEKRHVPGGRHVESAPCPPSEFADSNACIPPLQEESGGGQKQ